MTAAVADLEQGNSNGLMGVRTKDIDGDISTCGRCLLIILPQLFTGRPQVGLRLPPLGHDTRRWCGFRRMFQVSKMSLRAGLTMVVESL